MNIFLILLICFAIFTTFRSYLRGALICVMDTISIIIVTIISTCFFDQFIDFLYTTEFYSDAKESISGMMNYNSIMINNNNSSEILQNTFTTPQIITDFVSKNNTAVIYNKIGVTSFDAYITDVFAYFTIVTVSFAIVFAVSYFIIYIIRILVMPYINIVSLGKADKYVSIILGLVKSIIFTFIMMTFVPLLFIEFNYESVYGIICNSPILNYLYNVNPILSALLDSVRLR